MAESEASPQDVSSSFLGDIVIDDTSPPENDAGGNGLAVGVASTDVKSNKKGKKSDSRRKPKEQVPIEDLYDLSKPIKRIERPSKEEHEADIAAIESTVDVIRAELRSLQCKVDYATGKKDDKQKNVPLARERDVLNKLKNRKGLMIEQKRQIRTRLEIIKANADKLIGQAKSARSGMKFTTVPEIEKEIRRLQQKQETTSMSLADEKRLIKEMEGLQASKRTAEELQTKQGSLDSIKVDRNMIQADLAAKDKEIDSIQKQIDAQTKIVEELMEKQSGERGKVDELIKQKDELKTTLDEKFKEKNDLRAAFFKATDDWYQNQRAIKAQQQLEYDKEKKLRDEERAEWLKKKEEEELAKTPYEEEMMLCDYLADFLTKTYLGASEEELAALKAKAAEVKAKADVVAVKDDPFAGFKAVSKQAEDEIVYFGKGKGGKKANQATNKSKKANKPVAFTINLDLFEQFGMLSLAPPTSLDAVSASVEELRAKKKWYSEQPRGSVPTARDIRKANEEAAAKSSGGDNNNGKKGNKHSGKNKKIDISNDPDFVPLGTVLGGSLTNANWGQKTEEDGEALS